MSIEQAVRIRDLEQRVASLEKQVGELIRILTKQATHANKRHSASHPG